MASSNLRPSPGLPGQPRTFDFLCEKMQGVKELSVCCSQHLLTDPLPPFTSFSYHLVKTFYNRKSPLSICDVYVSPTTLECLSGEPKSHSLGIKSLGVIGLLYLLCFRGEMRS